MTNTSSPAAPPTVLIVEDRREVLDVLQRTLTHNGYRVRTAGDGEAGLAAALEHQPDLVILDVGLPKLSGLQVARELRTRGFSAPVLMLTARITVADRVSGLDAGADDYLVKPFDYEELLARVKALLRRSTFRADATVLRAGDLTLDPLAREVTRNGVPIALTQKEYALLEYLVRHVGQTLTREQITENVWKTELDPSTNVVDVYVAYLRRKLEGEHGGPLLHTVRGVGYVLRPAASE
jgi:two-component system, OmpR family, response regulator MprA